MNTKGKGSRREREVKKILETEGYNCTKAGASLGIFDIIAINTEHIRLIQVKSNMITKKEIMGIKNFHNHPVNTIKEIWIKKDYKEWKIINVSEAIDG